MDNNNDFNRFDSSTDEYGNSVPLNNEAFGLPSADKAAFKTSSSRAHLTMFLHVVITYCIVYAIYGTVYLVCLILNNTQLTDMLTGTTATFIYSSIAQYVFAFPLAILIIHFLVKPRKYEKNTIKFTELIMLFIIAEAFMLVGSFISNFLTSIIGKIFNFTPSNSVETIVNDTPVWLMFIVMVILAPIFEELLFRKLLIDRIGHFGDGFSILISAFAFAMMHTNLYQFIYAFLVGLIFGYIYTRTRNVIYTIVMHAILNFMGSVVAVYVQRSLNRLTEAFDTGIGEDILENLVLIFDTVFVCVYSFLQYGLLLCGIILLIIYLTKKKVVLNESTGTLKMTKEIVCAALINPGAILFYTVCLILTVISLFIGG